ncbi:ankyrin repeat-containing domain protein [Russula aff. rugulosa BPL654]|nr:ankyrin repeat-containing domain protein [Russula aff. rugulosa BPL654]
MREDLHRWLSPPDSSTNHNIACNAHHEGTATWFFKGSMFEEWRSTPSLLWIHGKPGSGKSVLCSGIIEDIKSLQETGSAYLAYFYCDFRDKDKQSRRNLVFSILWQLAVQSDLCCDYLSRLYSEHDRGKRKPSDGTLSRCLKEMLLLPTQGSIYLIIDALDECPNSSGMPTPREEVLDFVQDLVNLRLPKLHLCVTSRPEIDIRTTIEPLTSRCVSLHNQSGQTKDIVDYISSIVYSDRMIQRWRDEEKILVINTLSERANGMFRWVYCQLETLRQCLPPSVRRTLDELPETLDETYGQVLKTIKKVNREHAIRLLHCMTVAIRPLRVEELAEILAVDFDAAQQGDIPNHHQAVLSTCSSLIMIVDDGDSQVVQFSHFSVKEYLTSDRLANASRDVSCYYILPDYAHIILAQACLGVLLRLDDDVDEGNGGAIPLADYAAKHWVDHARFKDVPSRVQDTVEVFLDADKPHHAACLRLHPIDEGDRWYQFTDDSMPRGWPLYYASFYGFYDLAKHLAVKHPEHINARGGPLVSPLAAALYGEHFEVAELLHEHGANVNVLGNLEWMLLHLASRWGLVDTARWLLNHGADANAQKDDSWTPLHLAVWNERLEIVQMLLDHNADIHAQNDAGEVALHLAACRYINTLRLLLDRGADVNATDNEGSTPLHHSSFSATRGGAKGSVEGTRLLLEHGANIDAENNKGETPFQVAMKEGHHKMVEFLWGLGTMFS